MKLQTLALGLVGWIAVTMGPVVKTASALTFTQVNATQAQTIFDTFGAMLVYSPVEGASHLGTSFGLSLGVSATLVSASGLNSVVGPTGTDWMPAGEANVAIGLPFGLGIEAGILPGVLTIDGITPAIYGGDVKWNLSALLPMLPIDIAVRAAYTYGSINASTTISGVPVTVTDASSLYGATLSIGKVLGPIEPYVAIGVVDNASTITSTGGTSLFTVGTSLSGGGLSGRYMAGLAMKFGFISINGEWENVFGINEFAAKFALKF